MGGKNQWGKTLATKPDDLNSTPRTHVVDEGNWLWQDIL